MELAPPLALILRFHRVVLASVDVGAIGDVEDASAVVRVATILVVQAAVDAQKICMHEHELNILLVTP